MSALYLPFFIQGLLMTIDEKIHMKRGLGLWERLGHPLDTLTVFVPLSFIAINEYTEERMMIFIILAAFSSVFITKDEFIHKSECSNLECWIHSLLFVFHPVIFLCAGLLWINHPEDLFLSLQPVIVGIFMIYQILRWSFPWNLREK